MTISIKRSSMSFKVIASLMALLLIFASVSNIASTVYAQKSGKEVGVFLFGVLVGGVIYDGVKWGFLWATSALTPIGQAAVLSILAVAGISVVLVYMKNGNAVNYVKDSVGCTLTVGGTWQCPYSLE